MDINELISEVARRLKNPVEVKQLALASTGSSSNKVRWMDLSLACGYPGLLLFFANWEATGAIKEGVAHEYVLAIHQAIEKECLSQLSLYNGISGICFALRQASHGGTRYQPMQQKLDRFILDFIEPVYLKPLRDCRKRQESAPSSLHDLIHGLPGVARYLLEDVSLFGNHIESILKELVEFSKPLIREDKIIPGWHLSSHDYLNTSVSHKWPKGNFNLGLAHGIPGVLGCLSIAALKGIVVEGQVEAMTRIACWIRQQATLSKKMIQWHSMIPLNAENQEVLSRDAWCYGVPGIARVLFLCGKALKDQDLTKFAMEAFLGIFLRTREEWNLPGPMICHGLAGLLLLTNAMAKDSQNADLKSEVNKLRHLLFADYQATSPFGYRDIYLSKGKRELRDNPGLLEGTSGVLLTLLMPETKWDLPFMISA